MENINPGKFSKNSNIQNKSVVSFSKRLNQKRSGKKNKNLLNRRKFKIQNNLQENTEILEQNNKNIEPGEVQKKEKSTQLLENKSQESNKVKKKIENIEVIKENKIIVKPNSENSEKPQLLNIPEQTIFLQNVNYSTKESELKEFFEKFAPIEYAKICKSNNISKGTAFVMFKSKKDCESILSIYDKCSKNDKNLDSLNSLNMNPFEFQGKQLKIFRAYDKNDTSFKLEKKEDRRNREYLLFGLYKHFNGDLNDIDKEKREFLMKSKKENFKNNPNLFTSKTRLTVRNFNKKLEEKDLKTFLLNNLQEWIEKIENKEERIKLIKSKKIRQIKLLRDAQTNKSKVSEF